MLLFAALVLHVAWAVNCGDCRGNLELTAQTPVDVVGWEARSNCDTTVAGTVGNNCVQAYGNNENSVTRTLTFVVAGPAKLSWRWWCSTETGWDKLQLFVNGAGHISITGENYNTWQEEAWPLPDGDVTVEFRYIKDGSVTRGLDLVMLDHVRFDLDNVLGISNNLHFTTYRMDLIRSNYCRSASAFCLQDAIPLGEDLSYAWISTTVEGPGEVSYWWAVDSEPDFDYFSFTIDGKCLRFSGNQCSGGAAVEVGCETLLSNTGGVHASGNCLCQSGTSPVLYLAHSCLQGRFCEESCAPSLAVVKIAGDTAWRMQTVQIAAGQHDIKWQYGKDLLETYGTDNAWLSDIYYKKDCVPPANCAVCDDFGCTQCNSGFALELRACVSCGQGEYVSSNVQPCAECAEIASCVGVVTCSSGSNSKCSQCAAGTYKDSSATADRCPTCAAIPNCVTVTCTSASNQVCATCAPGYIQADANRLSCVNDNACAKDPAPCSGGPPGVVICTDSPPPADGNTGFSCACPEGYSGTGAQGSPCVQHDACASNPCDANADCVDAPPPAGNDRAGRACTCKAAEGYVGDGEVGGCAKLVIGPESADCVSGCTLNGDVLEIASTAAGARISFTVDLTKNAGPYGHSVNVLAAGYESISVSSQSPSGTGFMCTNANPCSAALTTSGQFSCTCDTGEGVGFDYVFFIEYQVATVPGTFTVATQIGVGQPRHTFKWDRPFIQDGSLQAVGEGGTSSDIVNVDGTSQLIQITATRWIKDPLRCQVYLGGGQRGLETNDPYAMKCEMYEPGSDPSTSVLQCQTPQGGLGSNNEFLLRCGGQDSPPSDLRYTFPGGVPDLLSIRGCVDDLAANTTSGCPTRGDTLLEFVGTGFESSFNDSKKPIIIIGGKICPGVIISDDTAMTCILPQGAGKYISVVISSNGLVAAPKSSLSYAPPNITGITGGAGCIVLPDSGDGFSVTECDRETLGSRVTITGFNFGSEEAVVRVGSSFCMDVRHTLDREHEEVTCILPNGYQREQPLALTVKVGDTTDQDIRVSYKQCQPGTYQATLEVAAQLSVAITECQTCLAGSFTDDVGQQACFPCPPGTQEVNNTLCVPCPRGTSQPNGNTDICVPCVPGRFTNDEGNVECEGCEPGRFNTDYNGESCLPCGLGLFQPNGSAIECLPCERGSFGNTQGRVECKACAAGRYTHNESNSECLPCPAGRAQEATGAFECESCGPGLYAAEDGRAQCLPCPAGRATNDTGSLFCQRCDRGTYADLAGLAVCRDCGVGEYSDSTGKVECRDCEPGRYLDFRGGTTCYACDSGTFQPNFRASECLPCVYGTFSYAQGQNECDLCLVGQFANTTEATSCYSCEPGFFQESTGSFNCSACDAGSHQPDSSATTCLECEPGKFQSNATARNCVECPAGKVQPQSGQAECIECPVGKHQPEPLQTVCLDCAPGRYNNHTAMDECLPCRAGRSQERIQSLQCVDCEIGKHTNNLEASSECLPCEGDFVAKRAGMPQCLGCGGLRADKFKTRCMCRANFYAATQNQSDDATLTCKECPLGTACREGELLATMPIQEGYWRADAASTIVYRCLYRTNCQGGEMAGDASCGINRDGLLCAKCATNFQAANAGGKCEPCEDTGTNIVFGTLIIVAVAVAVCVVFWVVLRTDRDVELEAIRARVSWAKAGLGASAISNSGGSKDKQQSILNIDHVEYVNKKKTVRNKPNFVYKLKIFVSFLQVVVKAIKQGNIVWPLYFSEFIRIFSFLNFDFIPWQSVGCVVALDFLQRALIVAIVPLLLLAALFLGYYLPNKFCNGCRKRDFSDNDHKRAREFVNAKKFVKLLLFSVFLLYPHVSSTVTGVYNCINLSGTSHLVLDLTIKCGSPHWNAYAYPMLGFVLLYPIGIPAMYLWRLHHMRTQMSDPVVSLEMGFLYLAYSKDRWYFEVVDMLYKLTMTSLLVILPNNYEVAAGMICCTLYLQVVLIFQPYVRNGDDRLHLLAQTELLLVYMCGMTMYALNVDVLDDLMDILLSSLLIIIVMALTVAFCILSLKNVYKIFQQFRRKKFQKQATEKLRNSQSDTDLSGSIGSIAT